MKDCEVKIFEDAEKLNTAAADFFVESAKKILSKQKNFSVALSGGSTPKSLYQLLASEQYKNKIEWQKVLMFFGDERCVSPENEQSNFRMANETLLSKITIPKENIFRLRGEIEPQKSAAEYEKKIKQTLGENPCFDLILLGLGDDAHTASLFPETDALDEISKLVIANFVAKFSAFRLTFTFPLINSAANILFLATGEKKSFAVKNVLTEKSEKFPASLVNPQEGKCFWFLDKPAASLISEKK